MNHFDEPVSDEFDEPAKAQPHAADASATIPVDDVKQLPNPPSNNAGDSAEADGAPETDVGASDGGDLADVEIECESVAETEKCHVTARRGKTLLHEDRFVLAIAISRRRFALAVARKIIDANAEGAAQRIDAAAMEIEKQLLAKGLELENAPPPSAPVSDDPDPQSLLDAMPQQAKGDAEQMLADPDLLRRLVDDNARMGIAGEKKLAAAVYLIGTSRLLEHPLAGRTHGHTSTGKSYVGERICALFPSEAVVHATQITPMALFYMPPGSLKHRWLFLGERSQAQSDDVAEGTRTLREMLSGQKLSKLVTMKVEERYETVRIEQEGPVAFTETTTMERLAGEDANRCVQLTSNEQKEQTRRILLAAANGLTAPNDVERIVLRHQAIQRILTMVQTRFVIPYAPRLGELFPDERPEARRAIMQVMSMIQALTLLHHRQRQRTADGAYISTADDYRIACHLLEGPMRRAIGGGISDAATRLFQRIQGWAGCSEFTTSDVYSRENFSEHSIRGWLSELAHAGILEMEQQGGRGKPYKYRIAHVGPPTDETPTTLAPTSILPSVEDVTGEVGLLTDAELADIFNDDRQPDPDCPAPEISAVVDEFDGSTTETRVAHSGDGNDAQPTAELLQAAVDSAQHDEVDEVEVPDPASAHEPAEVECEHDEPAFDDDAFDSAEHYDEAAAYLDEPAFDDAAFDSTEHYDEAATVVTSDQMTSDWPTIGGAFGWNGGSPPGHPLRRSRPKKVKPPPEYRL